MKPSMARVQIEISPEARKLRAELNNALAAAQPQAVDCVVALADLNHRIACTICDSEGLPEALTLMERLTPAEQRHMAHVVQDAQERRLLTTPRRLFVLVATLLMQAAAAGTDPDFDVPRH